MFGLSLASNCRHFDARSTNFEASSLAYCPSKEESISNSIFFPLIKSSAWNSKKNQMKREILCHKLQIYHNKTPNEVSLSSHYVIGVALFSGAGNQVPSNSCQFMVQSSHQCINQGLCFNTPITSQEVRAQKGSQPPIE
jgi:hypothetical protein